MARAQASQEAAAAAARGKKGGKGRKGIVLQMGDIHRPGVSHRRGPGALGLGRAVSGLGVSGVALPNAWGLEGLRWQVNCMYCILC